MLLWKTDRLIEGQDICLGFLPIQRQRAMRAESGTIQRLGELRRGVALVSQMKRHHRRETQSMFRRLALSKDVRAAVQVETGSNKQ